MGKRVNVFVKESISDLKTLRRKQSSLRKEKRVLALICLKESRFDTRKELAIHLGIHPRSLEKWIVQYKEHGLDDLLVIKPKRKGSKIITPEIHEGLKTRVHDAQNPFRGYWDARQWVQEEYGVEVNYQRVREYLIKHFGTKVKRPRKSHIQKDPNGEATFFKTTQHTGGA